MLCPTKLSRSGPTWRSPPPRYEFPGMKSNPLGTNMAPHNLRPKSPSIAAEDQGPSLSHQDQVEIAGSSAAPSEPTWKSLRMSNGTLLQVDSSGRALAQNLQPPAQTASTPLRALPLEAGLTADTNPQALGRAMRLSDGTTLLVDSSGRAIAQNLQTAQRTSLAAGLSLTSGGLSPGIFRAR